MSGLVLFLHGLTGDRHTWGAVPDFVLDSPLESDFEVATPEYSAKIRSRSDIETSASRVLTEIQTKYPHHEPIYLVGHSLGGLIAREICRQLLCAGPDDLLSKIPAAITVGTPMEGARFGNWILRKLSFLSPKIRKLADKRHTFDAYREAIRAAKKRSVDRPKQLHIRIEDDGVIASQVRNHFTEDDRDAGVIPGTHTNFAKNNDDAAYVAEVLLTQIRNTENSLPRPSVRWREGLMRPETVTSVDLPDRLVLIACSHGKREGGDTSYDSQRPAGWLPQPGLRQRVISKRSYVYSLLSDAKLADGFERGGNRAHQPGNRHLKHGPDLGGLSRLGQEAQYLPAWRRYNGRFYIPVGEDTWEGYIRTCGQVCVLIMSGLYGLIEPTEQIQNYDVHLTDTDNDTGQSVSSMWAELFTESLVAYINAAHRNRKVHIFNFLCDHHYVAAVQWHALPKECSVFHFASPTHEDVGLLPLAGTVLHSVLLNPDRLEALERDNNGYDISEFATPPVGLSNTKVIFEPRIGLSEK